MITVIIPALNEEQTIRQVIKLALKSEKVSDVIVIDDKSLDNTIEEAKKEPVTVATSTKLGKGASMREGLLLSKNNIIVYIDADITSYPDDLIDKLTLPIINNEADFVKSTFDRQAGRVTELVAKPLLSILFPELKKFSQPLSGMIAGKKEFFEKIMFENDYGVDIGILIDMYRLGVRIKEVNIGILENRMQLLQQLGKMSREVSRAILKRAKNYPAANLETLENITIIRDQMDFAIKESLSELNKMAIFDMDNTLIEKSFITTAAEKFGFKEQLIEIISRNNNPFLRTKAIAKLLKGKNIAEIFSVIDEIPVVFNAIEIVRELKKRGYICGIISDSYDCVTNYLKNKVGFDFSLANELEFSNGIATGEVKLPSFFMRNDKSLCEHDSCKSNALLHVASQYNIKLANIICIGDGDNDICSVKISGIGVSFCSSNKLLNLVADKIIEQRDFAPLLEFAS